MEWPPLRSAEPGGEAEAGRCTFEPGDYRTVYSDARNLRDVGFDSARCGRRVATHRRPKAVAQEGKNLRIHLRRQATRYRRQAGLPESDGGVCPQARRSRRRFPGVLEDAKAVASNNVKGARLERRSVLGFWVAVQLCIAAYPLGCASSASGWGTGDRLYSA